MKKRMGRQLRLAFTLVELLVVMSIIAMLASLLLPAVNQVREAGRRTTCINNQSNITLALLNYESTKKTLPGWCVPQVPWSVNSNAIQASWVFPLLPALDREDIYSEFGAGSPTHANYIPGVYANGATTMTEELHLKILVCPNDTTALGQGSNISYVVNGGLPDIGGTADTNDVTAYASPHGGSTMKESFPTAMFHNNYADGTGRSLTSGSLAGIADGAGNTLLCSENIDAGKWIADPTSGYVLEGAVTFSWFPFDPTAMNALQTATVKINKEIGTSENQRPRASSYHPGGVVAGFADRHATFIDENIDYVVWALLFTPRGREISNITWDAGTNGKTAPSDTTWSGASGKFQARGYKQVLTEKF